MAGRSRRSGADDSPRDADGARLLFFRQGGRRWRTPDGDRRTRRLSALWRDRLTRGRVSDDAPRLLRPADSFSQLPDPVAGLTGEGPRDRGAADQLPAAIAADSGAVRRAAAAGAP